MNSESVDYIVPQSKGGTHQLQNLQLLCNVCSGKKGAGTQAQLIAALKQQGIID